MNVARRFVAPAPTSGPGPTTSAATSSAGCSHGARFSLRIGALTILAAGAPGVLVGIVGAMAPPRVAGLVMRGLDVLMSFPPLLLAVAVAAALGTGGRSIVIALSVVNFPRIARVTREIPLASSAASASLRSCWRKRRCPSGDAVRDAMDPRMRT